jgi:hypothetical protein
MEKPNFFRMIQLAESIFDAKQDARQIAFSEQDMAYMQTLHPRVINEAENENGPISWVSIIPTSLEIMHAFLEDKINENELLQNTTIQTPFESIYLCSALTLPEFRMKNITFDLTLSAISEIRNLHPIQALFAWPFSEEGKRLCEKIAAATELNCHLKK